jgi:hypothetical protein
MSSKPKSILKNRLPPPPTQPGPSTQSMKPKHGSKLRQVVSVPTKRARHDNEDDDEEGDVSMGSAGEDAQGNGIGEEEEDEEVGTDEEIKRSKSGDKKKSSQSELKVMK